MNEPEGLRQVIDLTLPDPEDRQAIRRMLQSRGWKIYDAFLTDMIRLAKDEAIRVMIAHGRGKLHAPDALDGFLLWSGRIEALDEVASLLDTILDSEKIEEARRAGIFDNLKDWLTAS